MNENMSEESLLDETIRNEINNTPDEEGKEIRRQPNHRVARFVAMIVIDPEDGLIAQSIGMTREMPDIVITYHKWGFRAIKSRGERDCCDELAGESALDVPTIEGGKLGR